jgi:hypothetical protein
LRNLSKRYREFEASKRIVHRELITSIIEALQGSLREVEEAGGGWHLPLDLPYRYILYSKRQSQLIDRPLGHWAVRSLMFQAAQLAGVAPLRLSFTGTLSVIRRAIPKFQNLQAEDLLVFTWLIREIRRCSDSWAIAQK